jgi:hypothetical protein
MCLAVASCRGAFFIAKSLTTGPIEAVQVTVFAIVCYFMYGFQAVASKFLIWWITLIVFTWCSETIGYLVSKQPVVVVGAPDCGNACRYALCYQSAKPCPGGTLFPLRPQSSPVQLAMFGCEHVQHQSGWRAGTASASPPVCELCGSAAWNHQQATSTSLHYLAWL